MNSAETRYLFTVFTPTYNRARTIPRVYESLARQTFRDFEWLVVDDGSTDDTRTVVEGWREQADFSIRYFHQENQGKHVAFNHGVREAQGELFLTLDSDDACVPDALERFKCHWDAIPEADKMNFTSVSSRCKDQHGTIVGGDFPGAFVDSDSTEARYKYNIVDEMWGFNRTAVLKEFPFPVIDGSYVPEGIIWSQIGQRYRTRFINEALRVYWIEDSDTSDQLTRIPIAPRMAAGSVMWHEHVLNDDVAWFRHAPGAFVRSALHYSRFSLHTGRGLGDQLGGLKNPLGRLLWMAALPAGLLVYMRDKRRG
jgi:glycosyltransferase involved in cell wall biosynthesis